MGYEVEIKEEVKRALKKALNDWSAGLRNNDIAEMRQIQEIVSFIRRYDVNQVLSCIKFSDIEKYYLENK